MSTPQSKMLTLPDFVAKNSIGACLDPKDLCAVAQSQFAWAKAQSSFSLSLTISKKYKIRG